MSQRGVVVGCCHVNRILGVKGKKIPNVGDEKEKGKGFWSELFLDFSGEIK